MTMALLVLWLMLLMSLAHHLMLLLPLWWWWRYKELVFWLPCLQIEHWSLRYDALYRQLLLEDDLLEAVSCLCGHRGRKAAIVTVAASAGTAILSLLYPRRTAPIGVRGSGQ